MSFASIGAKVASKAAGKAGSKAATAAKTASKKAPKRAPKKTPANAPAAAGGGGSWWNTPVTGWKDALGRFGKVAGTTAATMVAPQVLVPILAAMMIENMWQKGSETVREPEREREKLAHEEKLKLADLESQKTLSRDQQAMADRYMKEAAFESQRQREDARNERMFQSSQDRDMRRSAVTMQAMQGIAGNGMQGPDLRYFSSLLQ